MGSKWSDTTTGDLSHSRLVFGRRWLWLRFWVFGELWFCDNGVSGKGLSGLGVSGINWLWLNVRRVD